MVLEPPVPKRAKPQKHAQGRLQLCRLRSARRDANDSLTGPEPQWAARDTSN